MKRWLFIIVALLALTGQANAQRYLPGMRGLELRGGLVDGIQKPLNYYTGIGLSTYTKNGNRWVFGAEYLSKEYAYKNISIPKAQITAEGGYYMKFLSDPSKTVFLSIGGSALAGYETSNWAINSYLTVQPSATKMPLSTVEQSPSNSKPTCPTVWCCY